MKNKKLFFVFALLFWGCINIFSQDVKLLDIEGLEIPLCRQTRDMYADAEDHEVHQYTGYALCYRESYEIAEWVAYCLTREELQNKVAERTNDFREDTKITSASALSFDYSGSGFDRGHLAPAADMKWSFKAMSDCFLMSNMAPQRPEFNQFIWNDLENKVRSWAYKYGAVYVVTGPVLEKPAKYYQQIGKSTKIAVPEYFYKVLLAQKNNSSKTIIARAFIMPNKKCDKKIADYAVTIDQLEERTGLDFFSLLPDDIENRIERKINTEDWR